MSFVKSNISIPDRSHGFTQDEISHMTIADFDKLSLCDQIYIYNNYQVDYCRLTGRKHEGDVIPEEEEKQAQDFAEEFEQRIDAAFIHVLGHRCGETAT